jgi:hypothetical protein
VKKSCKCAARERPAFATLPNKIGFVKPMARPGAGAKKHKDFVQLLRLTVIEDV